MTEILTYGLVAMTVLNIALLVYTHSLLKELGQTETEAFENELKRRNAIVKNNPDFRPGRY